MKKQTGRRLIYKGTRKIITEHRRTEAALKESEARYRAVVEDQIELIRRFRPDGTLTFVNGAFCRYYEKTMEELLGQNIMILFPSEDHDTVRQQIFSLSPENPVAVAERRFVKPGGEVSWQQWVNRAIFDEHGQILEFQSVGRDITAQKQVEQELKESKARYRAVVEDQIELIRRFRPDGTLTFVNGAFCRYFDKTMEELLGKNFLMLIPPEDRDTVWQQMFSLSLDNSVAIAERRFVKPGGEVRWQQWVNRGIFDEYGKMIEIQSVGRDITAQKEAELRIAEAREATARASRVATLAIIGGGIAHEINQPLNAIKVLAETILYLYESREQPQTEKIINNVKNISHQVDRIDTIVNHLRSFLRTSQKFDYLPCDLNDVVETALSLVNNQLLSRHIRVKKYLPANLPPVYGCFVRFEQVVLNLLMNAMQALDSTEQKEKEITIRTWADEQVNLVVSDNGPGISPEAKEKIFEPFYTTKKAGDSMGLGLSIVQSIVTSSNGMIFADNKPQGGAMVQVSFPICSR